MRMKFHLLFGAFVLMSSCFWPGLVLAEPSVSAVNGLIEDQSTVRIFGTGFGETAEPSTVNVNQAQQRFSRIELGNSAVYEDCTLREVQLPLEWRDDRVIIALNISRFQVGDSIYLFVVDENGQATRGYNLEVGEYHEEGGPGVPGKPAALGR